MPISRNAHTTFPLIEGLPAWSQIQPVTIDRIIPAALEEAKRQVDQILKQKGELTYESTFAALETAEYTLSEPWGWVSHLTNVRDSPELREVYRKWLSAVSEFFSGIPLNEELYRILCQFAQNPERHSLHPHRERFIEETLISFRQHGTELPSQEKLRLQKVESELSSLTQIFSEQVLDSRNAWEMVLEKEKDCAGLPDQARDTARTDALKKGRGTEERPLWRITLQATSMIPFMRFSERDDLRKRLWEGSGTVGTIDPWDNVPILRQVLQLRAEKAKLLGKAHFPDFVLERRMAKTGERAIEFVENLATRVRPFFRKEITELEGYKARKTGLEPTRLQPWEIAYWSEKMRMETYDFDEEQVRNYFPIGRVVDGLFTLVEKLFGVTVKEAPSQYLEPGETAKAGVPEVWYPGVQIFHLYRGERLLGAFFTDWHPRDNKRGGAWMDSLVTGVRGDDGETPHVGLVCGNLTPAGEKRPSLLTHHEVETIFHEFGHLLHHLMGDVQVRSLNGTNVAWDFVELPSQIMENWCWDKTSLDLFAAHYETGEVIPEDLWQKMLAARNFQSALHTMRQLTFGKADLDIHLDPSLIADGDINQILREHLKDFIIPTATPSPAILPAFTHLFSSPTAYASGYYSYKWAEVLDADAFGRFQEEGILNPETGRAFVETILSKGNSEDPAVLFRNFRGRDPEESALLERSGLT